MSILKIDHTPSSEDITTLTEEFPEYIKLSADLNKQILYGGSRLHYDCEQKLVKDENSENKHIWSGGVNLTTKKIDYEAVANIKPSMGNPSSEIIDPEKRRKFKELVKIYFPNYE